MKDVAEILSETKFLYPHMTLHEVAEQVNMEEECSAIWLSHRERDLMRQWLSWTPEWAYKKIWEEIQV